MTQVESAAQTQNYQGQLYQNQVQKGLVPMFLAWSRFITWTVLLSALLAVLFALAVDGCAGIH
jgi:hypothetical protein